MSSLKDKFKSLFTKKQDEQSHVKDIIISKFNMVESFLSHFSDKDKKKTQIQQATYSKVEINMSESQMSHQDDEDSLGYTQNDWDQQTINFELEDRMLDCLQNQKHLLQYRQSCNSALRKKNQVKQVMMKNLKEKHLVVNQRQMQIKKSPQNSEEKKQVSNSSPFDQLPVPLTKLSPQKPASTKQKTKKNRFQRHKNKSIEYQNINDKNQPDIFDEVFGVGSRPVNIQQNIKDKDIDRLLTIVKGEKEQEKIESKETDKIENIQKPLVQQKLEKKQSQISSSSLQIAEQKPGFSLWSSDQQQPIEVKDKGTQGIEKVIIFNKEQVPKKKVVIELEEPKQSPKKMVIALDIQPKQNIQFNYSPIQDQRPKSPRPLVTFQYQDAGFKQKALFFNAKDTNKIQPISLVSLEPVAEERMPIFLQRLRRINSIFPNFYNTNRPVDHEKIIKDINLILNTIKSAICVLELLYIKLKLRKLQLKDIVATIIHSLNINESSQKALSDEKVYDLFMNSGWQNFKIQEIQYIRPKQKFVKRLLTGDNFQKALKNFNQNINHYLNNLQLDLSTKQGKQRYFRIRYKNFCIEKNLKMMSQDLYTFWLVECHFPYVYEQFLQFLKNPTSPEFNQNFKDELVARVYQGQQYNDCVCLSVIGRKVKEIIFNQNL